MKSAHWLKLLALVGYSVVLMYMGYQANTPLKYDQKFVVVTVTPVPTKLDKWCATVTIADYDRYVAKADCECNNEKGVKNINSYLGIIGGKPDYYEHWIVGKAEDYYGEAVSIAFNCLLTPTAGAMVEEAQLRRAECELRWFLKKTNWDDMESEKSNYWDDLNELQQKHDLLSKYYNLSIQRLNMPPFEAHSANAQARYNNVTYLSQHIDTFMGDIFDRMHQLSTAGTKYNPKTQEWEDKYTYKLNKTTRKWVAVQ